MVRPLPFRARLTLSKSEAPVQPDPVASGMRGARESGGERSGDSGRFTKLIRLTN
jgi:hypothetical protein